MTHRHLPIIGNLVPTPGRPNSYTATEPITPAQLGQISRKPWYRKVNTTDGRAGNRYYLLVEFDGQPMVIVGDLSEGR